MTSMKSHDVCLQSHLASNDAIHGSVISIGKQSSMRCTLQIEQPLRPRLHEYVFIPFFNETANFSLRFHPASTPTGSKMMIVFTENDNFWKRSPKWKDLKTQALSTGIRFM